ncbi:hypothetical protein CEXT_417391 [Caerostris extrusa]|uniref:Uncharacterized protein n=1 Tax=Caerostris extrusa TaxID=172846 RepID=A0AAV4NLD9_CAEEX|nr:hypothetical protein CEXT_417391 [Caerostris extrusa]
MKSYAAPHRFPIRNSRPSPTFLAFIYFWTDNCKAISPNLILCLLAWLARPTQGVYKQPPKTFGPTPRTHGLIILELIRRIGVWGRGCEVSLHHR